MNVIKTFSQLYQKYGPQFWWPLTLPDETPRSAKLKHTETPAALTFLNQHSSLGKVGGKPLSIKNLKSKIKNRDPLFEICLGAILTQNTAWQNVEKALHCLLEADLMSPRAILKCPLAKLQKCVRASGYYKQKTKKLKIFSQWLIKKYRGQLPIFFKQPLEQGRRELLSLWGIGPETADSILLYAGEKPVFVIDAYTRRLCQKYGVRLKSYDEYQKFFETQINANLKRIKTNKTNLSLTAIYQEYHALIVRWGKEDGR